MKSKLTLRLDERLIKNAKKHAKSKNTSVSQLVANYFKAIDNQKVEVETNYSPITASLIGVLEGKSVTEKDYKSYLEKKHLK